MSSSEWRDFLTTDGSGLILLYMQLEFDWLYLTPCILFFKFALICPSIFAEPNSIGQLVGIATMEFLFGVFMIFTNPYHSYWTDVMTHSGCVHQMFLIGL